VYRADRSHNTTRKHRKPKYILTLVNRSSDEIDCKFARRVSSRR